MAEPTEPDRGAGTSADPTPTRRPRRADTTPRQRRRQRRTDRPPGAAGEPETATGQPSRRRRSGRRAVQSRRRRRRARLRTVVGVVVLLLVAAAAIVVASLGLDRARDLVVPADDAAELPLVAPDDPQPALAVVTYDETSGETAAAAVVVLAFDREADQGTVLLVPLGTVADVPGHGSFTVGDAYTFGEGPLVAVTVDNLLDVRLDGVVTVSREGWAELVDALGPVEVEVRDRLVAPTGDGGGEVRFEAGRQQLDGAAVAEFLAFRAAGETELETLPRVQQVLAGLLDRVAEDPAAAREAFAGEAVDAPDPEFVAGLFAELADARHRERVTTLTLPVSPLGTGRDDLYRLDAARAEQLIDERLAASRPTETTGAGRSLQVLNGNGTPGIGQQVAERLQPGGYRTLLTGNADRFDHETTRIVIYDDSAEQLAVARDIRDRLGVGEIERSGTPQSVVDVTIVVGRDFPPG